MARKKTNLVFLTSFESQYMENSMNLSEFGRPVCHCKHLIDQTCKIRDACTICVMISKHKKWYLRERKFNPSDMVWFWRG